MSGVYAYFFLVGLSVSLLLTFIVRKIALKFHFLDHPSKRKVHKKPIPMMGGVAIFLTFFGLIWVHILGLHLFQNSVTSMLPSALGAHLSGALAKIPQLSWITLGGVLIAAVGLYDDRYSITPKTKFVFQILVAALVVWGGIRLSIFVDNIYITSFISILWLVLLMNSFNLLDNMDGLSAGIALIASALFAFVALLTHQYFLSISLLILCGTCAGFLFFNFHPATLFMGDCGSQLIGYLMGVFTILETFYQPLFPTAFPILMPLIILAVPLYDTASVIVIRLLQGEPIFKADKRHFSHRIRALGMTTKGAVLFIYLVTLALGLGAPVLPYVSAKGGVVVLLQTICMITIVAILETFGGKKLKHSSP